MAEALNDDPVYVAVSKDVGESRLTLTWALRNLRLKKLYLLHVHQQISMNPTCKHHRLSLCCFSFFYVPRNFDRHVLVLVYTCQASDGYGYGSHEKIGF